ncbi:MAG TPA: peptidoglycan-associated lipoprotein Pal [Gammaproteobacteria bacterium]|nr:peptidoglycan-associated lipoprotein Pal [Gammaproteobacteria bacterium]
MLKPMISLVLMFITLFVLAACSSESTKEGNAAVVDKTGLSDEEKNAKAHAVPGSGDLQGNALEGASNPLSRTVVYFDYDSSDVHADDRPVVEAHAAKLAGNHDLIVTLEGHADERGSREYNLALGERRAQAVKKQMVLLGVAADQIRTVSYGEERPADPGHDEAAYSKNRRVEIIYAK